MKTLATLIASAFIALAALTARPVEAQPSPVGTWVASVGGQDIVLVLAADGTGTLNGDSGSWRHSGGSLILSDNDGESVTARYTGDRIVVTVEGVTLDFRRRGGSAAKPPPASTARPGAPFRPKKKLTGKTVRLDAAGARFTIPTGWKHGWSDDDEYAMAPRRHAGRAAVTVSRTLLGAAERRMSITQLLNAAATELLEGTSARPVIGPESFTVAGKTAGRLVGRAFVDGTEVEGYLGALIVDGWAYAIVGVYAADLSAEMRAGIDTVLATFVATAPKPNRALARKMARCWELYNRSSGGVGTGVHSTRYSFNADGTYQYTYYMSVSVEGASTFDKDEDAGSWRAYGSSLHLSSDKGESKTLDIRFQGGFAYLNGSKYMPC